MLCEVTERSFVRVRDSYEVFFCYLDFMIIMEKGRLFCRGLGGVRFIGR